MKDETIVTAAHLQAQAMVRIAAALEKMIVLIETQVEKEDARDQELAAAATAAPI